MMTSLLTLTGVETAFHTSGIAPVAATRPRVRVIWGRVLGSTYQGYSPSSPAGSRFSRPLTCPSCGGSLELHQRDEHSHDRLSAGCHECGFESDMDVANDGRITLS